VYFIMDEKARLKALDLELLPQNEDTRQKYAKVWSDFQEFLEKKELVLTPDSVFLYLGYLSTEKKYVASTLFSLCSALSVYIQQEKGVPLKKFAPKTLRWLKVKQQSHVPKQAGVFELEHLKRF